MTADYPGKKVESKRVIAEPEYLVMHYFQHWPGDKDCSGIDIFRFDVNGKTVKH